MKLLTYSHYYHYYYHIIIVIKILFIYLSLFGCHGEEKKIFSLAYKIYMLLKNIFELISVPFPGYFANYTRNSLINGYRDTRFCADSQKFADLYIHNGPKFNRKQSLYIYIKLRARHNKMVLHVLNLHYVDRL